MDENKMMADVIASVIARIVPGIVEREVARQVDGLADGIFTVIDMGSREEIDQVVHDAYGLHCARVAAELGVKVADFAKIKRDVRVTQTESDGEG